MNNSELQSLLGAQVLELSFVRRHPKLGWMDIRGMFGTTNYQLLNGPFGHEVLGFVPPKGVGMSYDYKAKGLCVVWDIFRREYRVFGAEQVDITRRYDLNTPEDQAFFEQYMYDKILTMTTDEQNAFMGYIGMANVQSNIQKPMNVAPADAKQAPNNPNKPENSVPKGVTARLKDFGKRVAGYFKRKKK